MNNDMNTKVRVVFKKIPPSSFLTSMPHEEEILFSVTAECDDCTANHF